MLVSAFPFQKHGYLDIKLTSGAASQQAQTSARVPILRTVILEI